MVDSILLIPIERHCMPLIAYRMCHGPRGRSAIAPFALLFLVLLAGCGGSGGDTPTGQPPAAAVATVTIGAPATSVNVSETIQLAATLRDQSGNALSGRTVVWTTANAGVATVSNTGLVSGVAVGSTTITATSEGKSGTAAITVTPRAPRDFAIVGAQFTQGVQDSAGSIPMVLSGNAAAVNVLIRANPASATPMQVVLRLFNAAGTLVRADTAVTTGTLGASPGLTTPSAQFLVPAATLAAGLRWQIARDPRGVVGDDTTANDVFPPTGTQALATIDVPTLNVRFVPIVLASHNNATGLVTDALIPEYLRTLKSIYPIGRINAHVGTSFTTAANFGTAPSGGDATFWTQVLAELDLARTIDPTEPTSIGTA
jgi:Bacterial surface proteins containing Ig-like domains